MATVTFAGGAKFHLHRTKHQARVALTPHGWVDIDGTFVNPAQVATIEDDFELHCLQCEMAGVLKAHREEAAIDVPQVLIDAAEAAK